MPFSGGTMDRHVQLPGKEKEKEAESVANDARTGSCGRHVYRIRRASGDVILGFEVAEEVPPSYYSVDSAEDLRFAELPTHWSVSSNSRERAPTFVLNGPYSEGQESKFTRWLQIIATIIVLILLFILLRFVIVLSQMDYLVISFPYR